MASHFTTLFSADALGGGADKARSQEQPVVLLAFAKLVILSAALVLFMPYWMDLLRSLVDGRWGALRLVSVGGGLLIIAMAALLLKVWAGLLKHLARAD